MAKMSTSGVQPFIPSMASPLIFILSIHDVLKYLSYDVVDNNGYAFLDRPDILIDVDEEMKPDKIQFYINGLLISGLLDQLSNEKYVEVERDFNALVSTLKRLLQQKIKSAGFNKSHSVFEHKDDAGDIFVGFVKNNCWREYNDDTGYLKLCS